MVATKIFAKLRAISAGLVIAGFSIAATPALANSSASATDIGAPLRAAQQSGVTSGEDEQFSQIFDTWQDYEEKGLAAVQPKKAAGAARLTTMSIPSLAPLQTMRMTSDFGVRVHPVTGGRKAHHGIDLGAATGTPIHATADGVIETARWYGGYGLYVAIEHGGTIETRYGHMSRLNVAEGQSVRKGDVIGYVGSTGRSTGPHLHYEVRIDGSPVDPEPYLSGGAIASALNGGGQGGE